MHNTQTLKSFFTGEKGEKPEPSTIVKKLYERVLEEHRKRLEDMVNPKIVYVTDLVSCSQKRAFRIMYPELTFKFDPTLLLGELVHIGLEEILKEHGFECEKDFSKTISGYEVRGRVDAINDKCIVEIKTARSDKGLPHEHHIAQLQIYLNMLERDVGILVYVTPDRIAEYVVNRDNIDVETLLKQTVENIKHPRYEWECRYCIFSKICPYRVE